MILNGAATIAALLYGNGDFVETVRHAFNFGWDCDNNAATAGTILTVRYHTRHAGQRVDYNCQCAHHERGQPICQTIPGHGIDRAIGNLLLEMVQPVTLELAFAVQAELQVRLQEVDQLRRQQVERARYEAELARNRFMQVDPNNRLVADVLEADWNDKLRALTESQEHYEQQHQKDRIVLDEASQQKVLALAQDLSRMRITGTEGRSGRHSSMKTRRQPA